MLLKLIQRVDLGNFCSTVKIYLFEKSTVSLKRAQKEAVRLCDNNLIREFVIFF